MYVGEKLPTEQPCCGLHGLERPHLAEHLATIVTGHPNGGDLSSQLVRVQIGRMGHIDASVSEVHRALRVVGKAREKRRPYRDHLVGLPARESHSPRQENVLAIAKHPAKGVAGQRSTGRRLPSHDYLAVQPPGENHAKPVTVRRLPSANRPWNVPFRSAGKVLSTSWRWTG